MIKGTVEAKEVTYPEIRMNRTITHISKNVNGVLYIFIYLIICYMLYLYIHIYKTHTYIEQNR